MKAIRVAETGEAEALHLAEIETPEPGSGMARVRLAAAGLNFIDVYHRRGYYPMTLPFTPGYEGAGIVDAVGEGVTQVRPGDRVAYVGPIGAYAEYAIVPAEMLTLLPESLSFVQGAAFPLQGMTAHYLLHEYRKPKPGDVVLIHAAAGGMGLLLVQWAKHLGARVLGTTSTAQKAEIAREAGADEVILYTEQDFVAETMRLTDQQGANLIIDGVGKTTFAGNLEAAAVRGQIVIFGSASGPADPIAPNALQRKCLTISGGNLFTYVQAQEERQMRANAVLEGLLAGWLTLRIDHVLPLSEAAEAHRLLESRASVGKIVLRIADL